MQNFLHVDTRTKEELLSNIKALFFFAVVAVVCFFIARKIAFIPSRLEVVIFLAAILLVPILKFPSFGLGMLFAVPLVIPWLRRVFYLIYEREVEDPILLVPDIIAGLLFVAMADKIRKSGRFLTAKSSALNWILLFIGYQLLRIFVLTSGVMKGLQAFKLDVLYILTFFFVIYFVKNFRQVVSVFKFTSIAAFLLAVYGIKQAFIGYTSFEEIWLDQMRTEFVTLFIAGTPRPFSTLSSPAAFADFMLIGMIASLALGYMSSMRSSKLYLAMIPVMAFALLLTSVRSNWVGALAAIFVWLLIVHRASFKKKVIAISVVLVIGFTASLVLDKANVSDLGGLTLQGFQSASKSSSGEKKITDLFVKERVAAITNPFEEHSMRARVKMWGFVLQRSLMLPQGPLGWGLGKFDAHSYYFTVLFETGYPGLMLLLLILVLIFKVGYSLYLEEENRDKRVVARAIVTLLVTICVLNSTGPHTSSHPADIYFWGSAGLLFVLHRLPLFSNTSGYHDKGRLTDAT